MTLFGTLKFLHVLAGFWMTAGLTGRGVAQLRAEHTTEIRSLQLLVELIGRFDRLMVIPGSMAVFLLGLVTAWVEGLPILGFLQGGRTNWLLASVVLFVGILVAVPTVFLPRGKVFGEAFADAIAIGGVTDRLSSALRDPVVRLAHIYEVVAILAIIWLMVAKPF
jgi:Predicted integral membrane protein (DUF2269)